jgi:hypothetical protein
MGQHQVQDYQVRLLVTEGRHRQGTVVNRYYLIASLLQIEPQVRAILFPFSIRRIFSGIG